MKAGAATLFLLTFLMATLAAKALPSSPNAQEALQDSRHKLESFDRSLSLRDRWILGLTRSSQKKSLGPNLERLYEMRVRLLKDVAFWEDVARLKEDLLKIPGVEVHENRLAMPRRHRMESEAEALARVAIQAFGELKEKYRMIRPAGLQNILINTGFKKEGFCWHWTRDLTKRIYALGPLQEYDVFWATAHGATLREHNTVVISVKGRGLIDGWLLDGWRKSGRPFWTRVATDHYPWRPGTYYGTDLHQ